MPSFGSAASERRTKTKLSEEMRMVCVWYSGTCMPLKVDPIIVIAGYRLHCVYPRRRQSAISKVRLFKTSSVISVTSLSFSRITVMRFIHSCCQVMKCGKEQVEKVHSL